MPDLGPAIKFLLALAALSMLAGVPATVVVISYAIATMMTTPPNFLVWVLWIYGAWFASVALVIAGMALRR